MRIRTASSLLIVCMVLTSMAQADEKSVRKELEAEYAQYDKALLKGISHLPAWCEAKLAPDFTMRPQDGKEMNRKEFMTFVNSVAKQPDSSWKGIKEQSTTIRKLTMDGGNAVATITSRGTFITTDTDGQFGPKNKDHRLTLVRTYRETWTKASGAWKVKRSEELGGSMLVDGKPMSGPKK